MISVLMPVYNGEKYLSEAIESILNQSLADFEFIILDDASNDSSREIINSYLVQDERIRYYRFEQNRGAYVVLNDGLSCANGKYIAIMDSDDVSLPERFRLQFEYLEQNKDVGVLGAQMDVVDANGTFLEKYHTPVSHDQIAWALMYGRTFAHPSVMLRRSVIQELGGYDNSFRVARDHELWSRMVWSTHFANLPHTLLRYRTHSSSSSVVNSKLQAFTVQKTRQELMYRILGREISSEAVQWMFQSQTPGHDLPDEAVSKVISLFLESYDGYKARGLFIGDASVEVQQDLVSNLIKASRSVKLKAKQPAHLRFQALTGDGYFTPINRLKKKVFGGLKLAWRTFQTSTLTAFSQESTNDNPDGVTVIVLSYERMKSLELMLKSLCKQDMGRIPFELVLCNNSPRFHLKKSYFSGVGRVLKRFPDVKILNVNYSWRTGIRYALASLAKYNTICFLDDDVVLHRQDFLAYMVENYKKLNQFDILSCWCRLWSRCEENDHEVISLTFQNTEAITDLTRCDVAGPGVCMFNKKILSPNVLSSVIAPEVPGTYDMGFSLAVSMEHGGQSYFLPSHGMLEFHDESRKAPLATSEQGKAMNAFFKRMYRKGYKPVLSRLSPSELRDSPEQKAVDLIAPVKILW